MLQILKSDSEPLNIVRNLANLQGSNSVDKNDTKNDDESIKKDEEIAIYNSSSELVSVKNSGWDFQVLDLDEELIESDGTNYYYNGFSLTRYQNIIERIIFNEDYTEEIVEGIYVGMDLDEVEKVLGKPTLKTI